METPSTAQYQQLVRMMDAFVAGEGRSRDFVKKMEDKLAACGLDDDDQFSDLQLVLAMFGPETGSRRGRLLVSECRHALRLLRERL